MEKIILTDNGQKVLMFLQQNDHNIVWVGKDIGDKLGLKGVYSTLESLIKNGLVEKCDMTIRPFVNSKGIEQMKAYQTYKITDFGIAFEI